MLQNVLRVCLTDSFKVLACSSLCKTKLSGKLYCETEIQSEIEMFAECRFVFCFVFFVVVVLLNAGCCFFLFGPLFLNRAM